MRDSAYRRKQYRKYKLKERTLFQKIKHRLKWFGKFNPKNWSEYKSYKSQVEHIEGLNDAESCYPDFHVVKERADKKLKKELLAEATTEIDTNDWCDGCYDDCNTCAFRPLN